MYVFERAIQASQQKERRRRFVHDATKGEVLDEGEERCVPMDTTTETADDACETKRVTTTVGTQTLYNNLWCRNIGKLESTECQPSWRSYNKGAHNHNSTIQT